MDDNLRQRLGRVDPVDPAMPTDDTRTPRVRALLEEIMNTNVESPNVDSPSGSSPAAPSSRRRLVAITGVAAAIVAIAIVVAVASGGGSTKKSQLTLALPTPRPGQSCIQFSTDQLAQAADAFAGTVTAVGDNSVTVAVDHWYKASGTKADVVLLSADSAPGSELGVQFAAGQHYLVSATDGQVNGCGFSGEDSADLKAAFDTAFGA